MASDGATPNLNHFIFQNANGSCKFFYVAANAGFPRIESSKIGKLLIYEIAGVSLVSQSIQEEMGDNALLMGKYGDLNDKKSAISQILRKMMNLPEVENLTKYLAETYNATELEVRSRIVVLFPSAEYLQKS